MFYGQLFHVDQNRLTTLSRSQILVYTALISHGGKDRTFTGSHSKLSTISSVSVGSVKRALKHFEDQGWLTCSIFYQVKKYTLTRPAVEESTVENGPVVDQSFDPVVDHSFELPSNDTVDHSFGLCIDHSLDLGVDQSFDLHVKKNTKEINSFHDMTSPTTKEIFKNFFQRWKTIKGWKMDRPLEDVWTLFSETPSVDHSQELQVIDSWLMNQHHLKNGRCWSIGWFERLSQWFHREESNGGRKSVRLNPQQRYFFNFVVTDTTIPTPPLFEEESLAVKVAPSDQPRHLQIVDTESQEEDFGVNDMIEASKNSPTLQRILKERGLIS